MTLDLAKQKFYFRLVEKGPRNQNHFNGQKMIKF